MLQKQRLSIPHMQLPGIEGRHIPWWLPSFKTHSLLYLGSTDKEATPVMGNTPRDLAVGKSMWCCNSLTCKPMLLLCACECDKPYHHRTLICQLQCHASCGTVTKVHSWIFYSKDAFTHVADLLIINIRKLTKQVQYKVAFSVLRYVQPHCIYIH